MIGRSTGDTCVSARGLMSTVCPHAVLGREREKKRGGPFAHTHSISWLRSVERREPKSVAPQIAYSTHTFFHSSPVEFCLFLSLASRQRRNRKHWKRQESWKETHTKKTFIDLCMIGTCCFCFRGSWVCSSKKLSACGWNCKWTCVETSSKHKVSRYWRSCWLVFCTDIFLPSSSCFGKSWLHHQMTTIRDQAHQVRFIRFLV